MPKVLLIGVLFSLPILMVDAQPTNDNCASAISLTVDAMFCNGTSTNGDNTSAAQDGPISSCHDFFFDQGDVLDVWYSFVAPSGGSVIISTDFGGGTNDDTELGLYSGTCENLVQVSCDADGGNGSSAVIGISDLIPGNMYFIQVFSEDDEVGSFCIEVSTAPAGPANDRCVNALVLTVQTEGNCPANSTSGTTTGALSDAQPSCDGDGSDKSVWYTFAAPANGAIKLNYTLTSAGTLKHALYGACAGNELGCVTFFNNNYIYSGLTPGNIYWIQVWTDSNNSGTFDICLSTITPPTNDDCVGAITVPVNPDENCTTVASGTLINATASAVPDSCFGSTNDDVWFVFTATATVHRIEAINVVPFLGIWMNLYANNCGSLNLVDCGNQGTSIYSELTIGVIYFLRVYNQQNANFDATFDICIKTPPAPPVNNSCANAVTLTVQQPGDCPASATIGTTINATATFQASCASGGLRRDVWYTFVAPASGEVSIIMNSMSASFHNAAIFDACAGNEVYCNSGFAGGGVATGLIPGNTYFIQIWHNNNQEGTFAVCLQETIPGTHCGNPFQINNLPFVHLAQNSFDYGNSLTIFDNYACTSPSFWTGSDVVYTYTPSDTIKILITLSNITGTGVSFGLLDACPGGSCVAFVQNGGLSMDDLTALVTLSPGTQYFLVIGSFGNTNSTRYNLSFAEFITPPNCDAMMTAPADGATDIPENVKIFWTQATNFPDGYKIRAGTISGGTDLLNDLDVGNPFPYQPDFPSNTQIFLSIIPYNSNGDAQGCTEYTYTTVFPV